MAQKTVKIKLSNGGIGFVRNSDQGIVITISGMTRNGNGKFHVIEFTADTCDMREVVDRSKNWARSRVKTAKDYLALLEDNSGDRQ